MTTIAPAQAAQRTAPFFVTWGTWPLLLLGSLFAVGAAMNHGGNPGLIAGASIIVSALILIALEFTFPLRADWSITRASFLRDLKYFALAGATIGATTYGFSAMGIALGKNANGPLANWPLLPSIVMGLLAFEFCQYWQHRISHEARGRIGGWLWRVHVAHHLPDRVYALMHPAGHPINGFIVRGLVTIMPLYLLGISASAIILINLIIGIQGLVSHTNLDLRAGWFNHVLTGSELHRFHHSAYPDESQNYGVVTPIWDMIFGTYHYRAGQIPERLGVEDPGNYPTSFDIKSVLGLPFKP